MHATIARNQYKDIAGRLHIRAHTSASIDPSTTRKNLHDAGARGLLGPTAEGRKPLRRWGAHSSPSLAAIHLHCPTDTRVGMERIFAVDSIGVCCPALCALLHVGHRTAQLDHRRVSGGGANKATQRWPACTLVHDRCRCATERLPGLTMRAVGDRIAFKSSTEVCEQAEGLTRRAARSTLAAQPENAATRSLREEQAERSHVNLHVTGGVVRVRVPGQATVGTVQTGHSASPDQSRNTRKHDTQWHTPRVPTCSLLATDPRSRTPAQERRPHRSPPAQPGRGGANSA